MIKEKLLMYMKVLQNAKKGKTLIKRAMIENPSHIVIFFDYPWIGDVSMCCAYLPALFQKYPNKNYAIATASKSLPIIYSFIPEQKCKIIELSDEECSFLSAFIPNRFIGNLWLIHQIRRDRILVMNCWFLNFFRKNKKRRALEWRRTKCLGFSKSENTPITYPKMIEKCKTELKTPFVIINPYSNSMNLSMELFERIAAVCKQCGYEVYTNSIGEQLEIAGTYRLNVSVEELYCLAGKASIVISIRSGILDYIISNTGRMIVIYDKKSGYYPFLELSAWKTKCDLSEYVYDSDIDECLKYVQDKLLMLL